MDNKRLLLSGNEAVAQAAFDAGVTMGVGYPGTPSTEILENFSKNGGYAQWSPNEKVAMEVGIGAAFAKGRTLVTMKHVGLNVAADPFFTLTYTGVDGALVLAIADDPGMSSSQNEQDSRRFAHAAGCPVLEPSDSQEAYDFFLKAVEISERWKTPVMLRLTTRVCHSKTIVNKTHSIAAPEASTYVRDIKRRVMVPAFARPAHVTLREKLAEMKEFNEQSDLTRVVREGSKKRGIIANGISVQHALEADSDASVLAMGMSYPLPFDKIRKFAESVDECFILEEGDPFMEELIKAEGIKVIAKDPLFRFGEFSVGRVRKVLANDTTPDAATPPGKPPELCQGCSHRTAFTILREEDCIVTGDIGCYTLGVLPPFNGMDTCVCMGASIGVGLGMRHTLPEEQARKVVSVIGDSTFMHSGVTGLMDMAYNRPETGHVVVVLDNGITAMTGMQEHPATGRRLNHTPSDKVSIKKLAEACGIDNVDIIDHVKNKDEFRALLKKRLASNDTSVIIAEKPCIINFRKVKSYEELEAEGFDTCN